MKSVNLRHILLCSSAVLQLVALTACSQKVIEGGEVITPPAAYCSTVTSYSGSTITVSGTAYYAPRVDGNGEVADGGYRYRLSGAAAAGVTYTITVAGVPYSYVSIAGDTAQTITQKLATAINNVSSAPITASALRLLESGSYRYYTLINLKNYGVWPAHSSNGVLTEVGRPAPEEIRHAEIMVKDSSGNIIQCGNTDNSGNYSLVLPQATSGSYTVYVNSRVNSSVAKAYVLDYHVTNAHYSITKSVSATANSSGNNLLASGEGAVLAGAFNILDQIIKANEFLTIYVGAGQGCGTTVPTCVPYTAAPLVYAYWKKGVNPYTYYGVSSPSSFYTGDSKLYILGGINGDVDNTDTDHFDNSVIIHEYGHFLEDILAVSESPGGYHDGQSVIDPRLAWSEGFADFLQGAVTGLARYRDTKGNSSGTTGGSVLLKIDLETGEDIGSTPTAYYDLPGGDAEGLFREFSITRLLWDIIDPHPVSNEGGNDGGTDTITNAANKSMAELWTVFAGANGIKHSSNPFRHMGTVHKLQFNLGLSNWGPLRADEKQNGSANYASVGLREYATPLSDGACAIPIDPVSDGGDFDGSDLIVNNDFLSYYHSGGTLQVQLRYDTPAASPADLDLYVYNSDYTYGSSSSMAGYSQNNRPSGCTGTCTNVAENVNTSAPAGYYMINVMAYTGDGFTGGASTYKIYVNGTQKCLAP